MSGIYLFYSYLYSLMSGIYLYIEVVLLYSVVCSELNIANIILAESYRYCFNILIWNRKMLVFAWITNESIIMVLSCRIVDMFPPTLLPYFLYEVHGLLFWCVFIYVVVSNTIFIPLELPILLEHPRFALCCLILIFLCSAL